MFAIELFFDIETVFMLTELFEIALNNLHWLICHETKPNQIFWIFVGIEVELNSDVV